MAEQGGELGRAYIRVDADLSPLDAKLVEAKAKVDRATSGSGTGIPGDPKNIPTPEADPVVQVFKKRGEEAERATGSFTKAASAMREFVSKLLIPAAVATGIVRIVQSFLDMAKAAQEAQRSIDSANQSLVDLSRQDVFGLSKGDERAEAEKRVTEEIRKRAEAEAAAIKKKQEEIALYSIAQEAQLRATTGRGKTEEIERLEKEKQTIFANSARAQEDARERIRKDYEEKQLRDSRERAKKYEEQAKQDRLAAMEEEDRIAAQFEQESAKRKEAYSSAQSPEEKQAILNAEEAARQKANREINVIRAAKDKLEQEEQERRQRMMDEGDAQLMDSISREAAAREAMAAQVAQKTAQLFQQAFTVTDSSLERIEVGINRLIEVIQLREGQGL